MLDKAAQDHVSKRPQKRGGAENRLPQAEVSAMEFAKAVERPDQQIAFPWRLFSRRPA
jgi:hypothetical protein